MINNDALRSIGYILHISDQKLVEIVKLGGGDITVEDLIVYMRREEEPGFELCPHKIMAQFLNGLVIYKRGLKEDAPPAPLETPVTNNVILKKLRVAFELKDTDIGVIIEKAGLRISKAELGAFFRRPDHRNYRECGDQFLRNLMKGLTR